MSTPRRARSTAISLSPGLFTLNLQLVWIEPGSNVFLMQAVIYNRGPSSTPEYLYDPQKVDFALSLQLGKTHVILLYWFLRRVLVGFGYLDGPIAAGLR